MESHFTSPNVLKILCICLIFWLVGVIHNVFFHPLRHVPGPKLAKISQAWRNYRYVRGTWHDDVLELHQRYGNIVRIAPKEVSFVDAGALKNLYGHGTKAVKVSDYFEFQYCKQISH